MTNAKKEQLLEQLTKIVTELKRLNLWDLPPEKVQGTFFGQLIYGMIPGIHSRLSGELPLPETSNLRIFAARELDGRKEMEKLVELLQGFDESYNEMLREI